MSLETVQQIVCKQLGLDELPTPGKHLKNDLGANSLDMVEIVMELQSEFRITIPEEQQQGISDVASLAEMIKKLQR